MIFSQRLVLIYPIFILLITKDFTHPLFSISSLSSEKSKRLVEL